MSERGEGWEKSGLISPSILWFHIKFIVHLRLINIVLRLEWASLFDTEKLLGKQVMIVMVMMVVVTMLIVMVVVMVLVKRTLLKLTKVSWEALREALAVLERPSTVEEITDATWKVISEKSLAQRKIGHMY